MNPITDKIQTGTVGEILVQLRLLDLYVQATPPLKDSGNDLIALRGTAFRAIQVKTTRRDTFSKSNLPHFFHILAVVQLIADEERLLLDESRIYLVPGEYVDKIGTQVSDLAQFTITPSLINDLFKEE